MAPLPKTYKAVLIKELNGPFALSDVELKHPGRGEVLVKVLACGVCFSDLATVDGHMKIAFPRVPGHEIVGDIVEIGEGVQGFTNGQRVGGPWHGGHDGQCRQCRKSQFQLCDNEKINGVTHDGGYAEYVLLNAEAVVRVPKDMEPAQAAPLLCAGVTVFNGIRKMHVEQGAVVAVQGLGGLGHLAVQYASKMGYEVVVLSSGDDKAKFAKELGAHHYINTKTSDSVAELRKLGGAAIIVQTAPNPAVIGPLVGALAPEGTLLSLAPCGTTPVETNLLVRYAASIRGWPSGHAIDSEEAIQFAKTHNIKCMIEKYPLAKVKDAVDSLRAGKPRFRNVLVME
ncbi:hypothetical protein CDD83_1750 [Cordyceps sp. RAO-2017]|nr:hypothetical protein CDD83_1750 [Cordyceps sp. RAO-2017]